MSGRPSGWLRPRRSRRDLLARHGHRWTAGRRGPDDGFTLLELVIVVAVLPIVIAGIAAGLIAVFSIQGSVSHRLGDSQDAQVVSANYVRDVQSALQITTSSSATQCGDGTQLLGLAWNLNTVTNTYQTVVSYSRVQKGSIYLLRREYCTNGTSATPDFASTVAFDIGSSQLPPAISPAGENTLAAAGWTASQPVTNVKFSITEPQSNYAYSLSAVPANSSPPSTAGQPIVVASNTTCGFAVTEGGTVSNGTYAKTLCFVDMSSYNATTAAAPACQEFVANIPGGFTLSFCMSESGNQPMFAASLPTYPEAFMGNTLVNQDGSSSPFYTGLGCPDATAPEDGQGNPTPSCIKPAMYQTNSGFGPTNTLVFSNITVTTATGAPATGWEWVSADAETTDSNEQITWTSNQTLNLLPNSPGSPYGDTCNNLPSWNGPQGLGTTQVVCQSGGQEPSATKTGTPMVEALTPTTMTVGMKGAGLEAVAVGLLLS
ncbi:MAG TPA: prepilin-type N-terminal cleavage/methylation domain-containing protein [Acidimicrobiales bacterium]|nr:prepilin-type N-terminal cleavage/methylation domain-containing protein [Acidimicrobiales bacterium]